jgi:hypothetical protein
LAKISFCYLSIPRQQNQEALRFEQYFCSAIRSVVREQGQSPRLKTKEKSFAHLIRALKDNDHSTSFKILEYKSKTQ